MCTNPEPNCQVRGKENEDRNQMSQVLTYREGDVAVGETSDPAARHYEAVQGRVSGSWGIQRTGNSPLPGIMRLRDH